MHDWTALAAQIKEWGRQLGFDAVGIAGTDLAQAESGLAAWLAAGCHGEMDYMASHGMKRARPAELVPGTRRVIVARMNYRPQPSGMVPPGTAASPGNGAPPSIGEPPSTWETTDTVEAPSPLASTPQALMPMTSDAPTSPGNADAGAAIACYALGRDYHKLVRARLQKLADRIVAAVGPHGYRVFSDSAPVMEVALATQAGLGWRGKHTLLLSREAGSWFFLGELFTDLPLPIDAPATEHCGSCRACLDACPTAAIVAPYRVDARRCISYLTIELKGPIPLELRPKIGNRVYGCDDCQLCCPWNRSAPRTREEDFAVRHGLDRAQLVELFAWDEAEFEQRLAGSAIRRIGHERWLRNLAVGLGNAPTQPAVVAALAARREHPSALVREHVLWALAQHAGLRTP